MIESMSEAETGLYCPGDMVYTHSEERDTIPSRHPDSAVISSAMCLDGIGKGECFNIAAYGPCTYPQLRGQVGYGFSPPLAEQRQKLLPPLTSTHSLTSSASLRSIVKVNPDSSCPG